MEGFIIVAALIVIGIYVLVKYMINRRKGQDGTQYRELQNLVASALPGESGYRVAYGHREDVQYGGKVTRTNYYRYAIAFRSDCLWIAPLGFDKNTNTAFLKSPMEPVSRDDLGMVTANVSRKKDILILQLYRKDHSQPADCWIEANNRRSSRFHRVNICQPEACEALCEQMTTWAERVNPENTELQATWKVDDKNKGKASLSLGLGVAGIGVGWLLGPLGLLFGLIGLFKAHSAKKAGVSVPKSYITTDVVAIAVSLLNIIVLTIRLITIN